MTCKAVLKTMCDSSFKFFIIDKAFFGLSTFLGIVGVIRERPFQYGGGLEDLISFRLFSVDVKAGFFFYTPLEARYFFTKDWRSDFF